MEEVKSKSEDEYVRGVGSEEESMVWEGAKDRGVESEGEEGVESEGES